MFKLIIGRSKSKFFQEAVDVALFLGGEFDGDKITLSVKEAMKAYSTFFPLFKLNVLSWKNTHAYYNGEKVEPYRFMFKMEKKRQTFFDDVLKQLDNYNPSNFFLSDTPVPCLYYKREGNKFYFKEKEVSFSLTFKGKKLYEFVDRFSVGDIIYFE